MSPTRFHYGALASGLQAAGTCIGALAHFAPVPYAQQLISLAVSIAKIQQAQSNKECFQQLAKDICALVIAVVESGAHVHSLLLEKNLGDLVSDLTDIAKFVHKNTNHNAIRRVFTSSVDANKVEEYRSRIQQAVTVFGVKVQIRMHEDIAEIRQILQKSTTYIPSESSRLSGESSRSSSMELQSSRPSVESSRWSVDGVSPNALLPSPPITVAESPPPTAFPIHIASCSIGSISVNSITGDQHNSYNLYGGDTRGLRTPIMPVF